MFCNHCGKQVDNDTVFCPHCGGRVGDGPAQQPAQQQTQYAAPQQPAAPQENTIAIVGFIFSFFGGLIGLICSIIGYNNAKKGAPHKGLALAGIIISIVVMLGGVIGIIAYVSIIVAAAGAIGGMGGEIYYAVMALSLINIRR